MPTSPLSIRSWLRFTCLAALLFTIVLPALARRDKDTKLEIKPGPQVMSAEEKAIEADPEKGIDHAVILIEQTERDDSLPGGYRLKYHLRAKILSNEARELGDITVPVYDEAGSIRDFWAYVIKPDGTVSQVGEKGLKRQVVTETSRHTLTELKTALPDIEPGCVIDYGYDISVEAFFSPRPVALQRSWPIREVHYRWMPYGAWSAGYYISENDSVKVKTGKKTILVSAHDMPPLPDESQMPPLREVGVYFFPYYYDSDKAGAAYWNEVSKDTEKLIKGFCGSKRDMKKIIEKMGIPASAELEAKLRHAYDWLLENVANTSLLTKDERAKRKIDAEDSRKKRNESVDSGLDILEKGWAGPRQLTLLYTGLARALGAEAHFIRAVDRTQQYFRPQIYSTSQFDSYFIEIIIAGQKNKSLFADPGDGMPFGEVAWWLSGVSAFKSSPTGAMTLGAPVPGPANNPIKTRTQIAFVDDNEALEITYSRRGSGQAMLLTRRALRNMTAKEREKKLLEYCGNSASFEVSLAETGSLESLNGDYELNCQGESFISGLDEDVSTYSFQWGGVWTSFLPDFDAGERETPIVFSYPSYRVDEIHIGVPDGFETAEVPAPITHSGPFAAYRLVVSKSAEGYTVRRELAIKALMIKPEHYDQFVEFLVKLQRADETPVVFKKAGGA